MNPNQTSRQPRSHHRPGPKLGFARPAAVAAILLFGLLAGLCALPVSAQISLTTAVTLAQRNSSAVKLADADLRKAQAVYSQTKDVYVPNLSFGSSIGPPSIGFPVGQPSIASASIQSLAFSLPQHRYMEAARVGVNAATLSLKDALEQSALDVSTAYIELDTVDRERAAALEQQSYADRLVSIVDERQQAGVDPMSDLLQARLTAAQLKLRIIHLETRSRTLISQIATLTGLPAAGIKPVHDSIPEIPAVRVDSVTTPGILASQATADSRQLQARGDQEATKIRPLISFGAQYNRDATSLNNYNLYYGHGQRLKADNFAAGFSITIPIFDLKDRAKARESAADALRSTVEAEQAQRQNDVQIASLTGNLRELDALAEIASLKQQIAGDQLRTVQAQLQTGNGAGSGPGAPPQLSPKAEQSAHIDERQKYIDALDSGFDLAKTRLSLLRALGHMEDWLGELHQREPEAASN